MSTLTTSSRRTGETPRRRRRLKSDDQASALSTRFSAAFLGLLLFALLVSLGVIAATFAA